MSCALDPGRVERLFGNVADPGEVEDHRQPGEGPPADDRQRVDRDAIVAEPLTNQKAKAQRAQDAVERSENGVEDQEEHEPDGDKRHGHRKEDRRAQQGREVDRANAHCVGDQKSKHDGEGQRDHQPFQIVFQGDIEILVAQHIAEIGEPDERLGRRHPVPFKETQIDRINDGIADKSGEQDDRQDETKQRDEDMLSREGDE